MVTDRLVAAGLVYEGAKAFATPRRLALSVHGVPVRQPDIKEEKKGPRVGAPAQAIAGFLKAAGLTSIDQAKVQPDKKGDFYLALIEKPGRPAVDVMAEMIPDVVRRLPVAEIDALGQCGRLDSGCAQLHSILAHLRAGDRRAGRRSIRRRRHQGAGDETRGHRFMAPGAIKVRRFDDYVAKLEAAKVVLDPARRADLILTDAKHLAFAQGYELLEDDGLLAEVAGLVEWPVTLMGSFDAAYLAIPEEVIRATIRNNQKCFVLRDAATAKLTNKFILVANEEASDGGKAIVAGNERVIRARLSDAKFFYDTDLKDAAGRPAAEIRAHRVPRKARLAGRAHRAHRCARRAAGADRRRRCRQGRARRAIVQGRSADRRGRRISRAARPDGPLLRRGAGRGRSGRACYRGSLPPEGAGRSRSRRSGVDRGGAGRQVRHAGRILGDRREADRIEGSVRAAAGRARRHPHRDRKRIAAAAALAAVAALQRGPPR